MKVLKSVAITLFALLSFSGAHAFTPPYHAGSNAYVGTLIIQSTGSCKIDRRYENAVYTDNVRDSLNAPVGYGLISADGELLALRGYTKLVSGFYRAGTGVDYRLWFNDMNTLVTAASLSTLSGCSISMDDLITSPKSRYVWGYKTGKYDNIAIDYRFNGLQPATFSFDDKNNEIWRPNAFKGRMFFKGSRPM